MLSNSGASRVGLMAGLFTMENDPGRKALVKQFIKTWSSHNAKRCDRCGRRLKFHTGAWIGGSDERYMTCRSCGYENPSLLEKVRQDLIDAGWSLTDLDSEVEALPQCLGCGVQLLVSGDFTKVFCSSCGREWDRYEFEEALGGPLDPRLAGKLPLPMDSSPVAQKLAAVLDRHDIDYGTPYLVAQLVSPNEGEPIGFFKGMKMGWDKERGKPVDEALVNKVLANDVRYVAIYEEYLATYTVTDETTSVTEYLFDDYLTDGEFQTIDPGFTLELPSKKTLRQFNDVLSTMRMIHRANATPFRPVLFGEAARQADLENSAQAPLHGSLAEELERLAELRRQGLLDDAEFTAAKQRILGG